MDSPPFISSDVVIAIDHSTLALLASGLDVDQDGVVGRNREWVIRERETLPIPARSWTTDSGDTAEVLQLEVARALIPRLAERGNRLGLNRPGFYERRCAHAAHEVRVKLEPVEAGYRERL